MLPCVFLDISSLRFVTKLWLRCYRRRLVAKIFMEFMILKVIRVLKYICSSVENLVLYGAKKQNAHFKLMLYFNSSCLLHISKILCSSSWILYCTCCLIYHIRLHVQYSLHEYEQKTIFYIQPYIPYVQYSLHEDEQKTIFYMQPYIPYVQYSLHEDEHKMFETCRRQEELN